MGVCFGDLFYGRGLLLFLGCLGVWGSFGVRKCKWFYWLLKQSCLIRISCGFIECLEIWHRGGINGRDMLMF